MKRPRVSVWYQAKGHWSVGIEGPLVYWMTWRTIIVANYETRDSANAYAKRLRASLRA
jgi:hypothetical protein